MWLLFENKLPRKDDEILGMKSKWNIVSLKYLMDVIRYETTAHFLISSPFFTFR
jgi:hypothetical protein